MYHSTQYKKLLQFFDDLAQTHDQTLYNAVSSRSNSLDSHNLDSRILEDALSDSIKAIAALREFQQSNSQPTNHRPSPSNKRITSSRFSNVVNLLLNNTNRETPLVSLRNIYSLAATNKASANAISRVGRRPQQDIGKLLRLLLEDVQYLCNNMSKAGDMLNIFIWEMPSIEVRLGINKQQQNLLRFQIELSFDDKRHIGGDWNARGLHGPGRYNATFRLFVGHFMIKENVFVHFASYRGSKQKTKDWVISVDLQSFKRYLSAVQHQLPSIMTRVLSKLSQRYESFEVVYPAFMKQQRNRVIKYLW